ncbi:hypothetical protein [Nocardia sp. NBC_00416]
MSKSYYVEVTPAEFVARAVLADLATRTLSSVELTAAVKPPT